MTRDKRKRFSILSTLLLYFVGFGFGLGRGRESEVHFLDFVFKEFFKTRNVTNLKRVVPGCITDLCRAEMKIPSSQWSTKSAAQSFICLFLLSPWLMGSQRGADPANQLHYANSSVTLTPAGAFTVQRSFQIYIVSCSLYTPTGLMELSAPPSPLPSLLPVQDAWQYLHRQQCTFEMIALQTWGCAEESGSIIPHVSTQCTAYLKRPVLWRILFS